LRSVGALLADGTAALRAVSDSPRADAALLLSSALSRGREWLAAHEDAVPARPEIEAFEALCNRRREGVPIAYVLGTAGFYGREFAVDESVLVPRPESEHLIDESLRFIRGEMRALDVGCGSGAIACTLAASGAAFVDATDSSPAAIAVARRNAERLGVARRCTFHLGDLIEPVLANRYGLVVANLPYVPSGDLPRRPDSASFEPRAALDGGPDGLVLYRRLLAGLAPLLEPVALVLLEAAPPTIARLAELTRSALPEFAVAVGDDYAGLARYVRAERPQV